MCPLYNMLFTVRSVNVNYYDSGDFSCNTMNKTMIQLFVLFVNFCKHNMRKLLSKWYKMYVVNKIKQIK